MSPTSGGRAGSSFKTTDLVALGMIVYFALYVGWSVFRWGGPDLELLVNDLAFIPIGLVAIWFAIRARAATASQRSRLGWLLLALSFASFCLGDFLWFWMEVVQVQEIPYPSLADLAYIGFYPLALLGLMSLARERPAGRVRAWLDVAIVIVGTGTAIWVLVLAPVAAAYESDAASLLVAMAYPVGDMLVLFALVAAVMARLTDTSWKAMAFLGVGLFANVVADLVYSRMALEETYESGAWLDICYMGAWLGFVLAGWAQASYGTAVARLGQPIQPPRPISLLPYGAVFLVLGLLVVTSLDQGDADLAAAVLGAVVVIALTLSRQYLMARDNARLLEALAAGRMEARFRALVQNASDVIVVVDTSGTISYVTPSAERVIGLAPVELVGRSFAAIATAKDAAAAAMIVEAAAARPGPSGPFELNLAGSTHGSAPTVAELSAVNLVGDGVIDGVVITIRDVTERRSFEQQLQHQALHDPLTGLANRTLLAERIEQAMRRSARRSTRPAVLYLDLDEFKRVNDSRGHPIGDQVLQEVARRLQGAIRDSDTVARLGGDEFALLLEETQSVAEAEQIAERVRVALVDPIELGSDRLTISGSIGIVRPDASRVPTSEILRDADIAMYEAKRAASGSYCIFDAAMYSATVERVRLEEDVRRAVAAWEFTLAYQPVVDLTTRLVVGVEALLRWDHPTRGAIPPLEFIPVAEKIGQIVPLGAWVLEEACRTVGAWNAGLERPLRANVNVSVLQVEPAFVETVAGILSRTGFPAELLVLELTESVMAENRPEVMSVLVELRTLGVRVAIDDFGTGYSSLAYLQDLPIDELKIDRSFITALGQTGDSRLVTSIIQIGQAMQVSLIAEGIENEVELSRIEALGCDTGQGYLLGRPAAPEVIEGQLKPRVVA